VKGRTRSFNFYSSALRELCLGKSARIKDHVLVNFIKHCVRKMLTEEVSLLGIFFVNFRAELRVVTYLCLRSLCLHILCSGTFLTSQIITIETLFMCQSLVALENPILIWGQKKHSN